MLPARRFQKAKLVINISKAADSTIEKKMDSGLLAEGSRFWTSLVAKKINCFGRTESKSDGHDHGSPTMLARGPGASRSVEDTRLAASGNWYIQHDPASRGWHWCVHVNWLFIASYQNLQDPNLNCTVLNGSVLTASNNAANLDNGGLWWFSFLLQTCWGPHFFQSTTIFYSSKPTQRPGPMFCWDMTIRQIPTLKWV